jgi:hypothetical protein
MTILQIIDTIFTIRQSAVLEIQRILRLNNVSDQEKNKLLLNLKERCDIEIRKVYSLVENYK